MQAPYRQSKPRVQLDTKLYLNHETGPSLQWWITQKAHRTQGKHLGSSFSLHSLVSKQLIWNEDTQNWTNIILSSLDLKNPYLCGIYRKQPNNTMILIELNPISSYLVKNQHWRCKPHIENQNLDGAIGHKITTRMMKSDHPYKDGLQKRRKPS